MLETAASVLIVSLITLKLWIPNLEISFWNWLILVCFLFEKY